jgi:hypothetical protein
MVRCLRMEEDNRCCGGQGDVLHRCSLSGVWVLERLLCMVVQFCRAAVLGCLRGSGKSGDGLLFMIEPQYVRECGGQVADATGDGSNRGRVGEGEGSDSPGYGRMGWFLDGLL